MYRYASDLFTNSVSIETMEEDTANNVLFKSGANVSIFVFGGFVLEENEYSPETNTLQPIFQNLRQLMKCLKSI